MVSEVTATLGQTDMGGDGYQSAGHVGFINLPGLEASMDQFYRTVWSSCSSAEVNFNSARSHLEVSKLLWTDIIRHHLTVFLSGGKPCFALGYQDM